MVDGGWLHFSGERKVGQRLLPAYDHTWPTHAVASVRCVSASRGPQRERAVVLSDALDFRQPRHAVIILPDGRGYEGVAVIRAGWVHADVRRRTVLELGRFTYALVGVRSWPRGQIREIRWGSEP